MCRLIAGFTGPTKTIALNAQQSLPDVFRRPRNVATWVYPLVQGEELGGFMSNSQDLAAATSVSERTLVQMREHKVPPTPKNYLVWFTYTQGSNPPLTLHLNTLLAQKQELTTEVLDDLQERFFGGASATDIHSIGERLRT